MKPHSPSLHIQTTIDIRTLAKVLIVLKQNNISHHSSWAYIAKICLETIAGKSKVEPTVELALAYISKEGFSLQQLDKRGKGIREHLELEESEILDQERTKEYDADGNSAEKMNEMLEKGAEELEERTGIKY